MSTTSEAASLYLAVLPASNGLAVSLTDLHLVVRLDTVGVHGDVLAHLQCQVTQLHAASGQPDRDEPGLREFGQRLLSTLLPASIAAFLREAPMCQLTIQVDASLLWVPWELGWDGEKFLGERFRLCRRIVSTAGPLGTPQRRTPQSGGLRVLIVADCRRNKTRTTTMPWLNTRLRSMASLTVSTVHSSDMGRDELLRLIGANDVVHCMGTLSTRPSVEGAVSWPCEPHALDLGSIASLQTPPRLIVSQGDTSAQDLSPGLALAQAASALGLNLLSCESADTAYGQAFMEELYGGLQRGAALAEAVRSARARLLATDGGVALAKLRPELYGDGGAVLKERRTPADDTLRQVTIMSIDLVESTRLLSLLGAEKYSELLSHYHERCTEILRSFGGVPDDFQGDDGAMCYFGVPVASEDAAAQSLRAALQLVDAVRDLGLGIRVGVCTGEVVVRNGQPIGSAVHLAARLQAVAAPGTVAVSESTRRIVKDRFQFQPLEQIGLLKGFDHEQVFHRLIGPAAVGGPGSSSGITGPALTPMVGRGEELQMLQEHWVAVRAGSQRLVRILGEAGIGKSRLVREFKQLLTDSGHEVFESRCSQEHANSAFHPLVESLRHEIGVGSDASGDALLQRLREMMSNSRPLDEAATALLADLLALPLPMRHPVLEQSAERRRQLTVDLLVALARQRISLAPGCWLVEDIHWLDPSTAEFLDRLAMATRDLPLLILVTARSDVELRWQPRLAVHEAELKGLSPEQSRTMVNRASGERRLPGEIVQLITARADGVPLFIEESTRMMVDLGDGTDDLDPRALPVPATVLDLLTTRLDRLGGARLVAQIGGTIGREFPLPLLQAVMQHPESPIEMREFEKPLAELVRAGMLVAKDGEGTRFAFRHALMRDAAYGSLLERDRQALHQVIATVIVDGFDEMVQRQPELLAFHYTEAGMDAEALRYWDAAVRKSASRSAHVEAIAYVGSALSVLARMPVGEERSRQELRMQLVLAARLIATRGYGAERVERAYVRAMELARLLRDEVAVMRVLLGLESYHFMRADFERARSYALDAAERANRTGGAIQRIQTQWALANIRMHQGEMAQAVREMDDCRAAYERLEHRSEAVQDPGVMCMCYSAWSLWELGFPDEALARATTVTAHAERLEHRFSMGEAFGFRAAVQHFRGENKAALVSADRAVQVCEDGGFTVWLAHARVMRGRILADLGEPEAGVEEMRQGYALWANSGAVVTTPFYLTLRAEGEMLCRRLDEAWALLEQALAVVTRTGERYYEAEIRRLLGRLAAQRPGLHGADPAAEAEAWLMQALACARQRELASLHLRAATDLARLWQSQGRKRKQAIDLLDGARRWIQGGEGTRDLVDAGACLERLHALH